MKNYLTEQGLVTLVDELKNTYVHVDLIQTYILNYAYPIGTIYTSVNNVSPAEFLGGTWDVYETSDTKYSWVRTD